MTKLFDETRPPQKAHLKLFFSCH